MEFSFHYLLMANQAILHKKLLSKLKETELTLGQPKVLDYLKEHDGASQKEIALNCHIEPPSLTSILNRMEEKGMIMRTILNGNRRSSYIFLTESGKKLQLAVDDAFFSLEQTAFHNIPDFEKEQFMNTFLQIYYNLASEES